MKKTLFHNILLLMASLCLPILIIEIFDIFPNYNQTLRSFVFLTSFLLSLEALGRKDYYYFLLFMSIGLIYNPIFPPVIDHDKWLLIHIPCLVFITSQAYSFTQDTENVKVEMTAYALDLYLKELESIICNLSYYQTLLYLKKRYQEKFIIDNEGYRWRDETLPDFEFKITSDFFLPGQTKKGGVSAIGQNKFYTLEIHLNFALTRDVKYTLVKRRIPNYKSSIAANLLKNILKDKYHYLDVQPGQSKQLKKIK
jgi:hypothetical protein